MEVKFKDCLNVNVDAFYFRPTYWEVLVGSPRDSRVNEMVHERVIECCHKLWRMDILAFDPNSLNEPLPPFVFHARLSSSSPVKDANYRYELAVIWYGQLNDNESIKDMIQNQVKDLCWYEVAGKFYFANL